MSLSLFLLSHFQDAFLRFWTFPLETFLLLLCAQWRPKTLAFLISLLNFLVRSAELSDRICESAEPAAFILLLLCSIKFFWKIFLFYDFDHILLLDLLLNRNVTVWSDADWATVRSDLDLYFRPHLLRHWALVLSLHRLHGIEQIWVGLKILLTYFIQNVAWLLFNLYLDHFFMLLPM